MSPLIACLTAQDWIVVRLLLIAKESPRHADYVLCADAFFKHLRSTYRLTDNDTAALLLAARNAIQTDTEGN